MTVFLGLMLITPDCVLALPRFKGEVENLLSLRVAVEVLEYKEQEGETVTDSEARLSSLMVGLEGIKHWDHFFGGVHALFPVWLDQGQEDVTRGNTVQQDDLEIQRIRIDGFIGYPLSREVNPYLGLGRSYVRQERTGFVVDGAPVSFRAVEEIISWHLLLGVRGWGDLAPRLRWNYLLEGALPVDVDVTNTAVPGFRATNRDGFTFDTRVGVDYLSSASLTFGLVFYGGWTHWAGSGFQRVGTTLAKWPENDTYYLGGGFNISYGF